MTNGPSPGMMDCLTAAEILEDYAAARTQQLLRTGVPAVDFRACVIVFSG